MGKKVLLNWLLACLIGLSLMVIITSSVNAACEGGVPSACDPKTNEWTICWWGDTCGNPPGPCYPCCHNEPCGGGGSSSGSSSSGGPSPAPTPACVDNDHDGYGENCQKGNDCNDNNANINASSPSPYCNCDDADGKTPQAAENACNGFDDNCDGTVDEGYDRDRDGYTSCGGDCNDEQASIHPGVQEMCDDSGIDQNCDGDPFYGADPEGCQQACNNQPPTGYGAEDYHTFKETNGKKFIVQSLTNSDGLRGWNRICEMDSTKPFGIDWEKCSGWRFVDMTKETADPFNPNYQAYSSYSFIAGDNKEYLEQSLIASDSSRTWTRKCPVKTPLQGGSVNGIDWGGCTAWEFIDISASGPDTTNPKYSSYTTYTYPSSNGKSYLAQIIIHSDGRIWNRTCEMNPSQTYGVDFGKCSRWGLTDINQSKANPDDPKYKAIGSYKFESNDGKTYLVQTLRHSDGKRDWARKCPMDPSAGEGVKWNECSGWEAFPPSDPAGSLQYITVRAKGQYFDGWPIMRIRVSEPGEPEIDLNVIGQATVETPVYRSYVFITDKYTAGKQVSVEFTNDAYDATTGRDRNLFIDYVNANGTIVQAEDITRTTYISNGNIISNQTRIARNALERMMWGGILRFLTTNPPKKWVWASSTGNCCGNNESEAIKYSQEGCSTGCCQESQCFDAVEGCVNNGYQAKGSYCYSGNWIGKKSLFSALLSDHARRNSITDYSILCGTYQEVLNSYTYEIQGTNAEQYFNCQGSVPCATDMCVLESSGNTILVGSFDSEIGAGMLESYTNRGEMCNAFSADTNDMEPCKPSANQDKLWFNNKTRVFVYSSTNTNIPDGTYSQILQEMSSPINFQIKKLYNETRPASSPSINGELLSKCESGQNEEVLNLDYSNTNTNLCDTINLVSAGSCTRGTTGVYSVHAQRTGTVANRIFDFWLALTSKLRR